ncbi:MAG: hypothetical protein NTX45_24975, partial [Proteobacteria bacterium]|nr:hypothetical protein [Pseudomonadota bacterium]
GSPVLVDWRLLRRGLAVKLPEGVQPPTLSLFDQIDKKTHQKDCSGSDEDDFQQPDHQAQQDATLHPLGLAP